MAFSPLCQLNGGCMGCCGNNYISTKFVARAIKDNTREFRRFDSSQEKELVQFRDRASATSLRHGVCRNLIEKEEKLLCPLHPMLNKGKDLRIGHCDAGYFCQTARQFTGWETKKQNNFIDFILGKKLDNITYSLKMVEGKLWKEFEEK